MLNAVATAGFLGVTVSQTTSPCKTGTDLGGLRAKLSNLLTLGISIKICFASLGEQGVGWP